MPHEHTSGVNGSSVNGSNAQNALSTLKESNSNRVAPHIPPAPGSRTRRSDGGTDERSFAYDHPVSDTVPLADTPLANAINQIAESRPGLAGQLHHTFDHRIGHAAERFREAAEQEAESRPSRISEMARMNDSLWERQRNLLWERDSEVAPLRARVKALVDQLENERLVASAAYADALRTFDPGDLSDERLVAVPRDALESIKLELRLPWPWSATPPWSKWLWTFATVMIGALLGAGLVLASGFADADEFARKWWVFAAAVPIGIALAAAGKQAAWLAGHRVGQYRRLSLADYALALAAALVVVGGLIVIDATLAQTGLLAGSRCRARSLLAWPAIRTPS